MGVRRYRCTNRDGVVSGHDRKCTARSIRANAIEESVWEAVSNTLQSPDLIESEYRQRLEAKGVSDGAEMEEQRLRSSTKSLERRKDRLTAAYLDEVLDLDRYGSEMKMIEAEVSELDRQLASIDSTRASSAAESESLQRVESFCSEVAQGLRTMDNDGRRRLMELLVEHIDIEPEDKLKIHMVFPPDAATHEQSKAATPTGGLRHRHPEALEGPSRAPPRSHNDHLLVDTGQIPYALHGYGRDGALSAQLLPPARRSPSRSRQPVCRSQRRTECRTGGPPGLRTRTGRSPCPR